MNRKAVKTALSMTRYFAFNVIRNQSNSMPYGFGEGVRPAKAGMFSGSQSHQGNSQKLCNLGRIRGGNEADEADRQIHQLDGE